MRIEAIIELLKAHRKLLAIFMHQKIHHFSTPPLSEPITLIFFQKLSLHLTMLSNLCIQNFLNFENPSQPLGEKKPTNLAVFIQFRDFFCAVIDAGGWVHRLHLGTFLSAEFNRRHDKQSRANFVFKHPVIQFNQLIPQFYAGLTQCCSANLICILIFT